MYNTNTKKPLALAIALAGTMAASTALAESPALEEMVVTAQKREQNLQDTPIAVSAFSSESIEEKGISDVEDISLYVPNVQIAESPGGSTGATVGIRGAVTVNPAFTMEPSVGIYLDGVFIAKNIGGIFDVAELERVEVLRGPQGTLYGKNTVGGAINLITKQPSGEHGGKVRLGLGNFGAKKLQASYDSDKIANLVDINVSVSKKTRDGFYDNKPSGLPGTNAPKIDAFKELDSEAARIATRFDFSDDLEVRYTWDWFDNDNTPSMAQTTLDTTGSLGAFVTPGYERRDSGSSDFAIKDNSSGFGHAIYIDYQIGELTFKSITAYREMKFDEAIDLDGSDYDFAHSERHLDYSQSSQEFQLIGSQGMVDFVAGLYLFSEKGDIVNPVAFFGPAITNRYGLDGTAVAVYGQADVNISDQLVVSVGGRYTKEDKEQYLVRPAGGVDAEGDDSWSNFSPALSVTYSIAEDINTYARLAKGWRAGGFNSEAATVELFNRSYEEEEVTSYELGIKSRLLDQRIQVNAAVFSNDVKNMQLSDFNASTFASDVSNAGAASVEGFELELVAMLTNALILNINYGYLDANYDEYLIVKADGTVEDATDTRSVAYSPDNKVSLGLSYDFGQVAGGMLVASADWSYTEEFGVYNNVVDAANTKVEEYDVLNARITLSEIAVGADNSMTVSLWGKNLTDSEYRINGIPMGRWFINYFGDPRTYGLDVTYEF